MPVLSSVAAGALIDPTIFGNAVVDALNRRGANASRAVAQSMGAGVTTTITFPTEESDAGGFFTAGGSAFTVPAGLEGLYACTIVVVLASALTGGQLRTVVTGGPAAGTYINALPLTESCMSLTIPLDVGSTVSFAIFNGGAAVNLNSAEAHVNRVGL